jgi:hypothetical protein
MSDSFVFDILVILVLFIAIIGILGAAIIIDIFNLPKWCVIFGLFLPIISVVYVVKGNSQEKSV